MNTNFQLEERPVFTSTSFVVFLRTEQSPKIAPCGSHTACIYIAVTSHYPEIYRF